MRRAATLRTVPWTPDFGEFFDLAPKTWTPPKTMQTALNHAADRLVCTAIFTRPDGVEVKVRSTCRREGDGRWFITDRRLEVRL